MTRIITFMSALGFAMPVYAQVQINDGVEVGVAVTVNNMILLQLNGYGKPEVEDKQTEIHTTVSEDGETVMVSY